MEADALLDSNVIIAIIAPEHQHHTPSLALFEPSLNWRYAVAAHSFAEAYVSLTRKGKAGTFEFTPSEAWAALEQLRTRTSVSGLTASQSLETLREYAASGGIGARLYDALIGQIAIYHAIPTIVTWNLRHMSGLFPALSVVTPMAFLSQRKGKTLLF